MFNILFSINRSYTLLTGNEKHTNIPLNIIVNNEEETVSNVCDIIFREKLNQIPLKNFNILTSDKNQLKGKDNAEILWIKHDLFFRRYLQKRGFITLPERISMVFDTSTIHQDIFEELPGTISCDISKSIRMGYSYEFIENDEEKLMKFYKEMYVPYVKWKYGDTAKIATYTLLKHLYSQNGHILFIKQNEEYIFGGVFTVEKKTITTRYAGIMKDRYDHVKNGIMSLSYYQLIRWAHEHNIRSIDFGTARPFLNDGLLTFKRKWNMKLTSSDPSLAGIYALKIYKTTPAVTSFLENNPCIIYNKNKEFEAYIFKDTEKTTREIKKMENIQGLHAIKYIHPKNLIDSA